MADSASSEMGLRDYIDILQRRKWIIIEVFTVLVAVVAVGSFLQTPIYRATAALLVETEVPTYGRYEELPLITSALQMNRSQTIETHKRLITRRPVLQAVIDDLNLPIEVGKLRKQISVATFRDTNVLEINVDDPDPFQATRIANSIADKYIKLNQEYNRESAKSASMFLEQQLSTVKRDLANAEEELERYKRATGIANLEEETSQQIEVLGKIAGELALAKANAQAAIAQSRVTLEKLSEQEQMQLQSLTEQPNPVVQGLQEELARLEAQRAGLLEEYAPQSDRVRSINAQITQLKQQLSDQMQTILSSSTKAANPVRQSLLTDAARAAAAAAAAQQRVAALGEALQRAEAKLDSVPAREKELARLVRAEKVADRVYTLLLEKYQEVRIAQAMRLSSARLVEPAVVPEEPIKPRKKLNIALAGIFGLILGIMLASLIEYLDDTIKDPEEAGDLVGSPVLGVVPRFPKEERLLLTDAPPKSRVVEAFWTVRSNLGFIAVDRPIRQILVTSATAAEGKSFVTVNLAITIAHAGKNVIIVDSDLRRPSLHSTLGIANAEGLTTVLVGERDLEDVLQPTEIEGLRVLPSGPLPPNPVELLASDRMAQLCESLAEMADFVIYDSPPAIIVSDAVTLASRMDGVVLVVEQGGASRKLVVTGTWPDHRCGVEQDVPGRQPILLLLLRLLLLLPKRREGVVYHRTGGCFCGSKHEAMVLMG